MKQEIFCYEEGLRSVYFLVMYNDTHQVQIQITNNQYHKLYTMGVKENPDWVPEYALKGDS